MAKDIEKDIIGLRREIHMHPEIGLETPRTSALVARVLGDLGVEVRERVGGWGVVGLIRGEANPAGCAAGKRKTVALRADMDALPVQEETGKEYASLIPGVMHACGHDTHVAMLLGVAKILAAAKKDLPGDVKFLFQPGEEGGGGARYMIEDGALDNPRPDVIFGVHVGNMWKLKTGGIGVRPGPLMAASDNFIATIRGRGGHGAAPHLSIDPVAIAAYVVIALQTIVSREVDPVTPAVITVGTINAGTARNIIPETCVMQATVRYIDRELATFMPARIKETIEGTARAMRGDAQVEYHYGYPPLVNDPAATEFLAKSAARIVGADKVMTVPPTMGGEDMSYYLEKVPGTFYALGTGNQAKGVVYPNHHPKFDVDEDVLHVGTAVMVQAVMDFLGQ